MSEKLTLVIPCYNPTEGWEKQLADKALALQDYLKRQIRLVLVNDASVRNVSEEHISYLRQKLPAFEYMNYAQNRGKGYAVRKGVEKIDDGLIIYTDIDLPYEFESMKAVLDSLEGGADVAVGTRNDIYYENTPKRRTLISKLLRFMLRVVFHLPVTDTQCGLKGFNQKGKQVFMQTHINRFLFDMEFIALAAKAKNIRLEPVLVKLRSNIFFSRMNARILLLELWNFLRIFWITNFR